MRMNFSIPVIALIAGTALGYFLSSGPETPDAATESVENKTAIADLGEKASENALRARIKELEALLAEKEASQSSEKVEVAERRPQNMNPREMMERMKKEDPERFAQMTNRFARFRARRAERVQSKMDFLSSIDTSFMSEKAKDTHARLQNAILKREALEEQLHSEEISDEERGEIFREMHETEREMHSLSRDERDNLLEETAIELGYEGEDAADIVATIKEIFEATGGDRHMGPPGPPPGSDR